MSARTVLFPFEFDYRNAFTGTYICSMTCSSFVYGQPPPPPFTQQRTVIVKKDEGNSGQLIIDSDTIAMDTSGTYTRYYTNGHKYYSVKFEFQKIEIVTMDGGLGGGTSCVTDGSRL